MVKQRCIELLECSPSFFPSGFIGAYKNRLTLLQLFIGSLFVILLLQLIAAIVAFSLRGKAENQLRSKLLSTLPDYGNNRIGAEWDRLQQTWSCCGVDGPEDWKKLSPPRDIPKSCCMNADCSPAVGNGTINYDRGCYGSAQNLFFRYSRAMGGVSIFFFFVEVAGLVLGFLLLRDLKNNYGSV